MSSADIDIPRPVLRTCSVCAWKGITSLSLCYRRKEHPDGKPARWVEDINGVQE